MKQEDLEAGSYYYLSQIALLRGEEDKAIRYMNVAVQLDERVYKQLQKDPLFLPIRSKIEPPQKEVQQQRKRILTKKERNVNQHLTRTCILVEGLSNEDLAVMQQQREKQLKQEEKQKE